ncbi:FG-GAP-like repeat-containing protein [Sunxiuqinia indica]|uniref:FG-GAP-like repeat-containing protein n=1 Tax=Sunxiuqinia indica TaxID=2692584 RepID=UPI0013574C02|nr:FG-GAP-like repeat-containing protein [Sunxiuqinia indica]
MKYLLIVAAMMSIVSGFSQEFDIILGSPESGTKTHQARNSITFDNNYSYTPSGGTLTAEIVDPVVGGTVSYSSTVDPMSRSLNTSYLVGATNGAFNVDALGRGTYTIPFQVPEGVGGFAPSLSLTYSSNGGNGIAGVGWNIGGLSVITRSPKTYYHDGSNVGVDLTSTDRFSLDGQRLICVAGSYGANNSVYRTEIDNFSKITCLTDGTSTPKRFLVKTKSGETVEYGYEGDSDQTIDGLTEEVSWYVDKRTDLYGNIMEYNYIKQFGHNYLAEIKYGSNSVTFYYKDRTDKQTNYFAGGTLQQNLILDKIEMRYNSTLIKKYELKYNYHSTTYGSTSVLNEVVEYGTNNSRYNSTAFSYEYPTNSVSNYPYLEYNSYISTNYTQYRGDYNGDGRDDIFTVSKSNRKSWRLYYGSDYGGFTYKTSGSAAFEIDQVIPTDLNGDGMQDLMFRCFVERAYHYGYGVSDLYVFYYALSSDGSIQTPQNFTTAYYSYSTLSGVRIEDAIIENASTDFDGDGLDDMFIRTYNSWKVFGFTFNGSSLSFSEKITGSGGLPGDILKFGDFNGDGKTDLYTFDANGLKVYAIDGSTLNLLKSESIPKKDHHFQVGDFNSDGKTDIFIYGYTTSDWSNWQMRLSTGTGFKINYIARKKANLKDDNVLTGDFNGDGRTDILALSENTSGNPRQYYFITKPNGTDMSSEYYDRSEYAKDRDFTLGDYDGNGQTDILVTRSTNQFYRGILDDKTNILLSRIADGLNNTTSISYRRLDGAYSDYTKGSSSPAFPVFTYMGPLNVVSEYWINGGGAVSPDYSYTGLKIHRQGKGALGYEQIVVEDTYQGTKTETNSGYDATYYYPTVLSTKSYVDDDLVGYNRNEWDHDITKSKTVGNVDPIFPYIDYTLNRNVLKGQQDSSTYAYDPIIKGSLEKAIQKFDNGVTKTVTNTYYPNDEDVSWYIGRLKESTVKYEKSGETTISDKTTFTYYNDGKLKPDFVRYHVGTSWEYYINHDYNGHGNLTQEYKYSSNGGVRDTDYEYETNGIRLKKMIDPVGLKTDYTYDTYGRLQKEIDNRDNETTYTYDNMGRVATKLIPGGFQTTTSRNWGSDSYLTGEVYAVSTTGNDGSQSKTWYDKEGKELRNDVKGFGGSWIYNLTTYDTKNRLSKKYEPSSSTSPSDYTLYEYDTKNRVKKITYSGGKITNITYPGKRVTESTEGMTSWKETDSQGLLTKANDFGGTINYSYYPNGQVKKITHPDNSETSMLYDEAGNQTKLTDPSAGVNEYSYNAYGQIKTHRNNRGDLTNYSYESDGRLDKHTTGSEITDYTYDGTYKHLTSVSSPGSVTRTYSYATSGVKGRLTGITENIDGEIFSTTFDYDGIGHLYKRTHPSGVVEENVYDSNSGLLEKVKAGTTIVWDINGMNEYGQITSAKYGTNLTATMAYNKGLPQSATIGSLCQYSYGFDQKFGWPNSRTNNKHSSLTEYFGYENLRLDSIWGNSNATNGFGYETNGNIIRKEDVGLMEYDGYQITDFYAKDANLVPTDLQDINYTWFQQVKDVTEGDYFAAFTYNSDQQRCKMVMKQNDVEQYTRWYAGSKDIKEKVGTTETHYAWLGGDAYSAPAVSVKVGTTQPVIYYILRDYLGSITHVVKASDLSADEYSFDAWGRRRSANDWSYTLDTNDKELFAGRGFTGHEHLPEFGLINMNGRLYDPLLERFLSPDENVQMPDFTQNFNRYSYALNNPLRYTDPSGEFIFTLLAAIIPGAQPLLPLAIAADVSWMTDYAVQAATNYLSNPNGKPEDWFFKDIDIVDLGVSAVAGAASQGLANVGKLKKGHKLLKATVEYGLPAISARYDWKPFSDDKKWNVNRGNDFWAPYIFAAVKQGVATRNSNKVTDAILSDKPWLLRDPLKGGLLGTLLDVPASIFTGWLTNKATTPTPKDSPQMPTLPGEVPLPPNWWENINNYAPNREDIQNSLILNKF